MSDSKMIKMMTCPVCDGTNVYADVKAIWTANEKWEILDAPLIERGYCKDCKSKVKFKTEKQACLSL